MKKISTLLIFLCAVLSLPAQSNKTGFDNLSVSTDGENVTLEFTAKVGRRAATKGATVVYAPVIGNGHYKASFPAVVVQGRRALTNWQRHEWAAKNRASYENGIYTKNRGTVNYSESITFQSWMYDGRLEMETVTAGCCNSDVCTGILDPQVLPAPVVPEPEPVMVAETPQPRKPSVMEFLQNAFSFIHPESEFDPKEPVRFFDDERDDALTVYYRLNRHDIDRDYMDNRQTMNNLLAAINLIQESGEAEVSRVVVAGFASPEGSLELNDRLAWERAVTVKEYVLSRSDIKDENVTLFNGSADWYGLRRLVAADPYMPAKREVLDILDSYPIWDARSHAVRQTRLRSLRGGEPWRYMSVNYFPKLRNGAFIRVYFEMKEQ